ncbi:MAG TPA: hypothetical protein VLZ74_02670 [Methylocella sp.]|nr:hypothetical protein [Methylocella sp.]
MENSQDNGVPEGSNAEVHLPSADARGRRPNGKAAAPATLVSFDRAEAGAARLLPPAFDRLLTYASHAALAACLFGFAWAAGVYFSGSHSLLDVLKPRTQTIEMQDGAERAEMLRMAQKMTEDIRILRTNVEGLRAAQSLGAKNAAALEGLKIRLEGVKTETGASIAELAGKVERMQHEPEAKLSQIIDRLDRMEHQIAASLATASAGTASTAATTSPGKQLHMAEAKPALDPPNGQRNPQLIKNWVVRDVYDGIALVESPRGSIEVSPGETIPGAGTVKAIERRGTGWIVITSQGVVDSARDAF